MENLMSNSLNNICKSVGQYHLIVTYRYSFATIRGGFGQCKMGPVAKEKATHSSNLTSMRYK